jgi:hypothetical protein
MVEDAGVVGTGWAGAGAANDWLIRYVADVLRDSRSEVARLQRRLRFSYAVVVALSVVMFVVGVALLCIPARAALAPLEAGAGEPWRSLVAGGFGLADLAALFLFRPLDRIHALMGDMGQITLAVTSYQQQAALRLLEADATDRASLGRAAGHLREATTESLDLIQRYFESRPRQG